MPAPTGAEVWRDYVTDGVPSSGRNEPAKADARAWSTWLESLVTSGVLSSGPWFATMESMTLGYDANTIAVVYDDPTAAKNGLHIKIGASGSGSWSQLTTFLPGYQFVTASPTGASTTNAIVATTSPRLPAGDGVALVMLPVPHTNTAASVTVAFDGGTALTIKTRAGENPAIGELQEGDMLAGFVSGGAFRLITDPNALIYAQRAEVAQAGAEAARDIAAGFASDIVAQGNVPIFDSRDTAATYDLSSFSMVRINRFSSSSVVAPAKYEEVPQPANVEPSHAAKFQSADGKWWALSRRQKITPAMLGGAPDDSATDSTSAIVDAYAVAGCVTLDGMYYVGAGGATISTSGSLIGDDRETCGVAVVDGVTETGTSGLLNLAASGISVRNIRVDGLNRFRRGVLDKNGGNDVTTCLISNIYSSTASAAGIFSDSVIGSTYADNIIEKIESDGDAIGGNDNGASRAVQVYAMSDILSPYVVRGNVIREIVGEEGDGIQILCFASGVFYNSGKSVISDNVITRCSKRAIKIQAHDVFIVANRIVMLDDLGADRFAGIDVIDSENAFISNNDIEVSSTVRGISVTATVAAASKNPIVKGNRGRTDPATLRFAILVNNFAKATIAGNDIDFGYINLSNGDLAVVRGNNGRNCVAGGSSGFVHIVSSVGKAVVDDNTVIDGAIYTAVYVAGPGHIITNNCRMNDGRCVYVIGVGAINNIIAGNIAASPTLDAVIFSGTTSGAQKHVTGNLNMA